MAVLLIAKFFGDPTQLGRAYDDADQKMEAAMGTRMPPGAMHHVGAPADDGFYIVDVWESEEALRGMLESPQFASTLEEAGFPPVEQAHIEILPVHAMLAAS